ncbi:MAG: winged helix-turn-helix transcriptional regulator [Euryarchaeota archaeon]|nr:winged helix-turn-helix transcriptional regulator [Euryarchaeota archaeon]
MQPVGLEGLPPLRENPFNGRPLEKSEHNLLGGRDVIISSLTSLIRQRSARMVILKGERGSGRTSFIHALASQTEKHHSFTLFPESNHVSRLLDETYSMLVGFERPAHTTAMIDQMVNAVAGFQGPLQLLSYDFPSASGPLLCNILQGMSPALKRLKAMVIISLTPEQEQAFPEDLLNEFDSVIELEPMLEEGVREVIEKRISSVSRRNWTPQSSFIELIREQSGGHVGRLMRKMRDLVDESRMNGSQVDSVSEWQIEEKPSNQNAHSTFTEVVAEEIEEIPEFGDDSAIEERFEEQHFLLDEQEEPILPPVSMASIERKTILPQTQLPTGMFRSLAKRNRDSMSDPALTNLVGKDTSPELPLPVHQDDEADLWIEESAPLIQEETNTPSPSAQITNFDWQQLPQPHSTSNPYSGLAKRLAALTPQKPRWQSQSLPLEVEKLRTLSDHERVILEVAIHREFSPSDDELRKTLAVKRPRMSQLSNGLYRAGILQTRQQGRSRWFSLTNDARAQLAAWGLLEVEA